MNRGERACTYYNKESGKVGGGVGGGSRFDSLIFLENIS